MKRIFWRWAAYVGTTAGLVLAFVPLATHRTASVMQEAVFLGVAESPEKAGLADPQPSLKPEALADFPALRATVEDLVAKLDRFQWKWEYVLPRDSIPPGEWKSFQTRHAPEGVFVFYDRIFTGRVSPRSVQVDTEVPHLKWGCRLLGVLLLIAGLLAWSRAFPPPADGIPIGGRRATLIWDVCIMGVGSVFTWWFLEFVLSKTFQTATEWGEDFAVGMGVFWFVLAYPVLAFITTAMAAQSLAVSRDGIVLHGLLGASAVQWAELEGIHVAQTFSPRRAGGFLAPHRLMKRLEIHGGGSTLRVMEPPYASTKKRILAQLSEYAPAEWNDRLATVEKEWLSPW